MPDLTELQEAVGRLSGDELREFNKWYEEYYHGEGWDKQIEMDAEKGRLGAFEEMAKQALIDHRAGKSLPVPGCEDLDEVNNAGQTKPEKAGA